MTAKQDALYWREWGALSRRCQSEGWALPDRHELHARALGRDKSHKLFNNPDFDQVLGVFRSYSQAENVNAQLRQIAQPTTRKLTRLEMTMKCMALYVTDVEGYVGHVCMDKFRTPDWRDLSDVRPPERMGRNGQTWQPPSQVEQLVMTLSRCLNGADGLRNQAGDTLHDMHTAAGVPCRCSACAGGTARAASSVASQREATHHAVAMAANEDPDWNV